MPKSARKNEELLFPPPQPRAACQAEDRHARVQGNARVAGLGTVSYTHLDVYKRQDMRRCVNDYMSVVLNETPLDATLVDFDDSEAW